MPAEHDPRVRSFVVLLVVILPAAYLAWYLFAGVFALPAALLSSLLTQWLFADLVHGAILHEGVTLVFLASDGMTRAARQLQVYLPPLGSGLPLFVALSLASDARAVRHLINLALGWVALVLGQTLSVMFKVGATLFSYFPPVTAPDAMCSTDCYWAILYYLQYFTYMLFPSVLPVLVWALLYRAFVIALVTRIRDTVATPRRVTPGGSE